MTLTQTLPRFAPGSLSLVVEEKRVPTEELVIREASPAPTGIAKRLGRLLEDAQEQLDDLYLELVNAAAYRKVMEAEWQRALTQMQKLEKAFEAALRAEKPGLAQMRLEHARLARIHAGELGEIYQATGQLTMLLREAVLLQEEKMDILRRRCQASDAHHARVLEDFLHLQRAIFCQAEEIQYEFHQRKLQLGETGICAP